jgi:hypothetical protein
MELKFKSFSSESELCLWCAKNNITPKFITAQTISASDDGFYRTRIVVYY